MPIKGNLTADGLPILKKGNQQQITSTEDGLPIIKKKDEAASQDHVSLEPSELQKKQFPFLQNPLEQKSDNGTYFTPQSKSQSELTSEGVVKPKETNLFELTHPNNIVRDQFQPIVSDRDVYIHEKEYAKSVQDAFTNPTPEKIGKVVNQNFGGDNEGIKNRFYSANLNADDINYITGTSPILRGIGYNTSNSADVANKINQKTKALADEARKINSNGFDYSINQKDLDNKIYLTQRNINDAEVSANGSDRIFVNPNTTSLPIFGSADGGVLVNAKDYLNEQRSKIQELRNKKDFLEHDWVNNVYNPTVDKAKDDVVKAVEDRIKKTGSNAILDAENLKVFVNNYLKQKANPILMAGQNGVDPLLTAPLRISPQQQDVINSGENKGNFVYYEDQNGKGHTFKNDDYTDVFNRVFSYFKYEKPAIEYADSKSKEFLSKPENKKFAPLLEINKGINDYFNSGNSKDLEALLKTQADSGAAIINNKYANILTSNPEYKKLEKKFQDIAQLGGNPEQINKEFQTEVESNEKLKPLFKKRDEEIGALVDQTNKQRLQYIINGLKDNKNLVAGKDVLVDANGNITVKGATAEETKNFLQQYQNNYSQSVLEGFKDVETKERDKANILADVLKSTNGGLKTSLFAGVKGAINNTMEAFSRYYDIPSTRDYYGGIIADDLLSKSDLIKSASTFQGWKSLIDPNYYAYNIGQSGTYMIPGIVTGLATQNPILGAAISSELETYQNGLDTFNEMYLNGKTKDGRKLTLNEAANAAADDISSERLPNLVLAIGEFGALARNLRGGTSEVLKKTIGREILGATKELGTSSLEEAAQEGLQGYYQQSAKDRAQGNKPLDLFDYMQTDDFRQNFFGGLAGGIGFGVTGFGKRILSAPQQYQNWQNISDVAKKGYADFDNGVLRSYALSQELAGSGAQFRDGLRLRLMKNDFKDDTEKATLLSTLAYSANLQKYAKDANVSTGNINGLATTHHLAMADLYSKFADVEGNTARGDIYRDISKTNIEQAKGLMKGEGGSTYIVNKKGDPIFLTERDGKALVETGDLQKLIDNGDITNVSNDLRKSVKIEGQQEFIPKTKEELKVEADRNKLIEKGHNSVEKLLDEMGDNEKFVYNYSDRELGRKDPMAFLEKVANKVYKAEDETELIPRYGADVINTAKELFPNNKTQNNAGTLSENQRGISEKGQVRGTSQETGGNDLQQNKVGETIPTETKQQTGQITDVEQKAIDALIKKDPQEASLKPSIDVLKDENSTPEQKRNELQAIYNQLTHTENEAQVGQYLGKAADAVYELPYQNETKNARVTNTTTPTTNETGAEVRDTENEQAGVNTTDNGLQDGNSGGGKDVGGEKVDDIKLGELIDKPITYKGEKATLYQDGQSLIVYIDGKNKEYELGNANELKDAPISDFDIKHESSIVGVNDKGNIEVRGNEYVNNYSNPLAAINHDENGNVVSVNLETPDGKKRTFRGDVAEDIAYQIHLKEITKDNATKSEFENFINTDEPTAKQVDDARLSETTEKKSTPNNEKIQREKAKPIKNEIPISTEEKSNTIKEANTVERPSEETKTTNDQSIPISNKEQQSGEASSIKKIQEYSGIFNELDKAQNKRSNAGVKVATEKVVDKYKELGQRAKYINDNFDDILKQLNLKKEC